jgi:aminoglycoside 6'-N-acetyltransferase I
MHIRTARIEDADAWTRMRTALWPDGADDHRREIDAYFAGSRHDPAMVLVAELDGELAGFAELSLRSHAEGCSTSPVAYLEGWYVSAETRKRGVGRALIEAAEAWGRSQGCTEFASDTEVDNAPSAAAHAALGFEETGVVRCFRKMLL